MAGVPIASEAAPSQRGAVPALGVRLSRRSRSKSAHAIDSRPPPLGLRVRASPFTSTKKQIFKALRRAESAQLGAQQNGARRWLFGRGFLAR